MTKKLPLSKADGTWRPSHSQLPAREEGFGYSERRKQLLRHLQAQREGHTLLYLENGSAPPAGLLRHMFEHLRATHGRSHERLSLVLYARRSSAASDPARVQGVLDLALRLMALLREYAREVEVLVPQAAFGMASLLAVGADRVLLHPMATLGVLPGASLLAEARHFQGLVHSLQASQGAHEDALGRLVQEMGAQALGQRAYALASLRHALEQLVAGRVLPRVESQVQSLHAALEDERYPLARPMARRQAREALALAHEGLDPETEKSLWELFCAYEHALGLVPGEEGGDSEPPTAVLESLESCHAFYAPSRDKKLSARPSGWRAFRSSDLH